MVYTPTRPPPWQSLDEAQRYVQDQLLLISQEFVAPKAISGHEVLHSEPIRPRQGMIAYADGSDWNPGSGPGIYEYNGTVWIKNAPQKASFNTVLQHIQTIANPGIPTLVEFEAANFDTIPDGANGGLGFQGTAAAHPSSWTPPAGPILIIGRVLYNGLSAVTIGIPLISYIYKNGAYLGADIAYVSGIAIPQYLGPTAIATDVANGTDYYQVFAEQQDTVPRDLIPAGTYFFGVSL